MIDQNSSYFKVYHALLKTSTWDSVVRSIEDKLLRARVAGYTFEVNVERQPDSSGTARISTNFLIEYGDGTREYHWNYSVTNDENRWNLAREHLWPSSLLFTVVTNHFGPRSDVKTRNCKLEIIKSGRYKPYEVESFTRWAAGILDPLFTSLILDTRTRLVNECLHILTTEEFARAKHDSTIVHCKNSICKAMLEWRHMPDEVLKEAWDQYLATVIMDE